MATTDELTQGYLILSGAETDELPSTKTLDCGCCGDVVLYGLEATDQDGEYMDAAHGLTTYELDDEIARLLTAPAPEASCWCNPSKDVETVTVTSETGETVAVWGRTGKLDAI